MLIGWIVWIRGIALVGFDGILIGVFRFQGLCSRIGRFLWILILILMRRFPCRVVLCVCRMLIWFGGGFLVGL